VTEPSATPPAPPVEGIANAQGVRLGAAARALACATLACSLIGSQALLDWANRLPANAASDQVVNLAGRWSDSMGALGMHAMHDWLRQAVSHLRGQR
jgi:hypothetical protein